MQTRIAWLLGLLLLSFDVASAGNVTVRLTVAADGDKKDAVGGDGSDSGYYDARQDAEWTLLKRMPPIELRNQPANHDWQIRLNPDKLRQEIKGLGAALTDASAYVLHELKKRQPELYDFTLRRLFSPQEAGFSYLRRPMGSSDYTATASYYTYADSPSDDLSTFSIDHDREYIIPVLKDILRINPHVRIMATPWSPPAWMTSNEKLSGITTAEKAAGATNRLKRECFELYAEYFVRFIRAYAESGVVIHAVTLQNEPQFDAARYPCLRMTADDQIELIKHLGPKLRAAHIETRIFIHDHNWRLHPNDRTVVAGDAKLEPVELVTKILSDRTAGPYVAGSAWHCYSGNEDDMRAVYGTIRDRFPDRDIYCTELSAWGKHRGPWFPDIRWGLAHNWLGGLAVGASVALEWNLALDHKFGPTLRKDSAALGLVTINTDTWRDVKFEREFYAMAHVSIAARPGSRPMETIVSHHGTASPDAQFMALGFVRRDGSLGLFVMNQWNKPGVMEICCRSEYFDYALPPHGLATFVWQRERVNVP